MLLGFPGILLIFKFSEEFFDWIIDAVNGKYCYLETCIEPRCKFQTHKSVKVENHIERKIIFFVICMDVNGYLQWDRGCFRRWVPPNMFC